MKSRMFIIAAAGFLATSAIAGQHSNAATKLNQTNSAATPAAAVAQDNTPVNIDDVSYSFGFMMGSNMKQQKMDLKTDQFITGMQDGLAGKDGKFNRQEMMKMLMAYQSQVRQKQMEEQKKLAEVNKQKGQEFLTSNKSKPGVVALPSGLQYKIITAGTGSKPAATDTVKVTYTGTLINGEEFGSSPDEKNPVSFTLNQVIPAWKEALPLMAQGSTWELYVPASLAYGERGTSGKIGPNETLIFRIKLLEIEKGAAPKAQPQQSSLQNSQRATKNSQRQG